MESSDLCFFGDHVTTSPNAGWVLVHAPRYSSSYMSFSEKNRKLRRLGYVIWDRELLCNGGMFDLELLGYPDQLDENGQCAKRQT